MFLGRQELQSKFDDALKFIDSFPYSLARSEAYGKIMVGLLAYFFEWRRTFPPDDRPDLEWVGLDDPRRPYTQGVRLYDELEKFAKPPFNGNGELIEANSRLQTLVRFKEYYTDKPELIEHIEQARFLMSLMNKAAGLLWTNWEQEGNELKSDPASQCFMKSLDVNIAIRFLLDSGRLSIRDSRLCLDATSESKHTKALGIEVLSKLMKALLPDGSLRPSLDTFFWIYLEDTKEIVAIKRTTATRTGYDKTKRKTRKISADDIEKECELLKQRLNLRNPQ